jgi:phage gp45-like
MFKSRSGHVVKFDDTSGGEKIEIVTSNEQVKLTFDASSNKLQIYSGGDIEIEATNGVKISCMNFEVSANSGVTIEATGTAKLSGASTTVQGTGNISVSAPSISIG